MTRPSKEKVRRMHEYVLSCLAKSGVYVIRDVAADQYLLRTHGRDYNLFLHSDTENILDIDPRLTEMIRGRKFIANIFYKETDSSKDHVFFDVLDHDRALNFSKLVRKSYADARRMIELTGPESRILNLQRANELCYYVPDNTQIGGNTAEGLIKYFFKHGGMKYAMPDKKVILDGAVGFAPVKLNSCFMHLIHNRHMSLEKRHLNEVVLKERVDEFLRQNGKTLDDFGGSLEDIMPYIDPQ